MIRISNVSIKYGDRVLLDSINVSISPGEKIGLVGRNGAGKSTLLKIIAGEKMGDSGDVSMPPSSSLGFLHQEMEIPSGNSVIDEALTAFEEAKHLEELMKEQNEGIATRTDYESQGYMDLLQAFSEANDRFNVLGGHTMHIDAEKVLLGLGFMHEDLERSTTQFSGGWRMRIELAKMLLKKPDYLLLDEPTNHLDIESIIWLEGFLKNYEGTVILISHDKTFLDSIGKRTIEIEGGKIFEYKASYTKYLELREERRTKLEASFKNQQKVIAEKERTISRFMAKATKTKMAQSMQKQLNKIERIEMDEVNTANIRLRFQPPPRSGEMVVEGTNVSKHYGELRVMEGVDLKIERGEKVAFVGQNGQGKTTLSKMIGGLETLTNGKLELGHNVQIGYYAQNQAESMHGDLTVLQIMENEAPENMRTSVRSILGSFMFSGEDADKKVKVLSGGERSRLAMASLLLKPYNLLILDEPTNHLDIPSKDVLKQALQSFEGTLIVVSHDRDFLQGLTQKTIEFRDKKLYSHIGGLAEFLKKREVEDMRQIERQNKPKEEEVPSLSKEDRIRLNNERKQLSRKASMLEKKIEELEQKKEGYEKKMSEDGFFESASYQDIVNKHKNMKGEIEQAYDNWETAQGILEEWESKNNF